MSNLKEMRIFAAEQIRVQDEFPKILKDLTKEIIRKNPENPAKFARAYFEQLLKDKGYFEDHLDKLEVKVSQFVVRDPTESINDHYYITGVIGNFYDSKARIGVHKKTNSERCIKIVEKSSIPDISEYRNQIELQNNLDHPGIVKYLEWFEDETSVYLVCEYLKGGDLWDAVMNFGGKYTEDIAATIIKQLLQITSYLHKKGIPHRNIRTGNILFNEVGKLDIKLIDFDTAGNKTL